MRDEDSSRGLKSSVSQWAAAMFTITGNAHGSRPHCSAYTTWGVSQRCLPARPSTHPVPDLGQPLRGGCVSEGLEGGASGGSGGGLAWRYFLASPRNCTLDRISSSCPFSLDSMVFTSEPGGGRTQHEAPNPLGTPDPNPSLVT